MFDAGERYFSTSFTIDEMRKTGLGWKIFIFYFFFFARTHAGIFASSGEMYSLGWGRDFDFCGRNVSSRASAKEALRDSIYYVISCKASCTNAKWWPSRVVNRRYSNSPRWVDHDDDPKNGVEAKL